jgi:cupin superfamily acireductone dioxygenase involved in methionine salvage
MKMNGYFGVLQIVEKVNQVKLVTLDTLLHLPDSKIQELELEVEHLVRAARRFTETYSK